MPPPRLIGRFNRRVTKPDPVPCRLWGEPDGEAVLHRRADDSVTVRVSREFRGRTFGSLTVRDNVRVALDIHRGEVFYWFTDMGWIMGPLSMVGALGRVRRRC